MESISLEPNENVISISLITKSLHTKVPLEEAIFIPLRKPYEQDEPPDTSKMTGAFLAVRLANLWLKQYETSQSKDTPETFIPEKYLNGICPECNKKSRTGQKVWNVKAV